MNITESTVEEVELAWFSGLSVKPITAFLLRHIAAIRDALLPKLISVENRIKNIEN